MEEYLKTIDPKDTGKTISDNIADACSGLTRQASFLILIVGSVLYDVNLNHDNDLEGECRTTGTEEELSEALFVAMRKQPIVFRIVSMAVLKSATRGAIT